MQLLEELIARGAEEESFDEFDFPEGLSWEKSVRGHVGGLVVEPQKEEGAQGSGGVAAGASKPASVREVQRAGKRATSAGLELLMQAKHDERELVKAIRDEGARRRLLGSILVAWREVALRSGPGRREALRALRESRQAVYTRLGDKLMSGERNWVAFLAGVALLNQEAARARAEALAAWVPVGAMAALHWRMALLVRRWRMRRARRWEQLELGPLEYPSDPLVVRFHEAAGCSGVTPLLVLIGVEDLEGSDFAVSYCWQDAGRTLAGLNRCWQDAGRTLAGRWQDRV